MTVLNKNKICNNQRNAFVKKASTTMLLTTDLFPSSGIYQNYFNQVINLLLPCCYRWRVDKIQTLWTWPGGSGRTGSLLWHSSYPILISSAYTALTLHFRTLNWNETRSLPSYISHDDDDELADRLSARAERQVNSCAVFPLDGAGL